MSQALQIFGHKPKSGPLPTEESGQKTQPPFVRKASSALARNAVIVGVAYILSRLLGLAREVILANQFGTGSDISAYVSAFRIPDLLFLVIMAGAFGAAFIPVFGQFLTEGDDEKAWKLASAVLSWCAIAVLVLCVLCFIFARPLMWLVSPGFDDETTDTAVNLMRVLLLSPVFLGLGIASKGILEAQNMFTLSALAPLIYNVAVIVGAVWFVDDFGIYAVAWAVIAGAVGHFAVQIPGLIRSGIKFLPSLDPHVEGLRTVWRLLAVRVIGLAAFQINFVAVNAFASRGDESFVAALNYAYQLLMLPHGVLAMSASTVIFPTLASLHSQGKHDDFRALFERTLRPLLFLMIPASAGLLLLGEPIIRLLLQRGEFDSADTSLVNEPLVWFAVGLVGYGLTEILTRIFYAMQDTRTPVITTVLTILLNLFLCSIFVSRLDLSGLALALSITTASEAVIMMLFLRKRTGRIVGGDFWPWLSRVLGATLGMGVVILISLPWLNRAQNNLSGMDPLLIGIVIYAFGLYIVSFLAFAWILRIPELQLIAGKLTNRLPGPLRRMAGRLGLA
ncbi:MAG: murein biosynthesis integral membrane protein MurJ [Thermomicrobiales bacterium]